MFWINSRILYLERIAVSIYYILCILLILYIFSADVLGYHESYPTCKNLASTSAEVSLEENQLCDFDPDLE